MLFDLLEQAQARLISRLSVFESYDEGHDYPWENKLWRSSSFRRAHLDVVDARASKKLYMMHLCIFPHINDPAPVFGFDLIAGPTKVTGAFHDFSPIDPEHPLLAWFDQEMAQHSWSKERALPEWAQQIFSGRMLAAGNISQASELQAVLDLVDANLEHYLDALGSQGQGNFTAQQNKYCHWQKQNPHTPRVMQALGFDESTVKSFIDKCLFPEMA